MGVHQRERETIERLADRNWAARFLVDGNQGLVVAPGLNSSSLEVKAASNGLPVDGRQKNVRHIATWIGLVLRPVQRVDLAVGFWVIVRMSAEWLNAIRVMADYAAWLEKLLADLLFV